jgi:hypothetical protein
MDEEQTKELEALQDKLLKAANEVVKLKITTTVGDVKSVVDQDGKLSFEVDDSKTLHTEIDLLQGDIVSMVDQSLLSDTFAPVLVHHQKREEKGNDIIMQNMETLANLAQTIIDFLKDNQDDG